MEKKETLQKLTNQYFKSLEHFEKLYKEYGFVFYERLIDFNTDFLRIVSTIINNRPDVLDLNANRIYYYATADEKNELKKIIDSIIANI